MTYHDPPPNVLCRCPIAFPSSAWNSFAPEKNSSSLFRKCFPRFRREPIKHGKIDVYLIRCVLILAVTGDGTTNRLAWKVGKPHKDSWPAGVGPSARSENRLIFPSRGEDSPKGKG